MSGDAMPGVGKFEKINHLKKFPKVEENVMFCT